MPAELTKRAEQTSGLAAIDVSGLATVVIRFRQLFHTDGFSIGGQAVDPSRPVLVIDQFWTGELIPIRLLCPRLTFLAPLPGLLPFPSFWEFFPVRAVSMVNSRPSPARTGGRLTIHDAFGRIAQEQRVTSGSERIGIGSLAAGVYTCVVTTPRARHTGRFVKQ